MFKNKILLLTTLAAVIVTTLGIKYINYLQERRQNMALTKYDDFAHSVKKNLADIIAQKQTSTMAIALSLASDRALNINQIDTKHYDTLLQKYKRDTLYQNIWIQIVDKQQHPLYKSWSQEKNVTNIFQTKDITEVFQHNKPISSVTINQYDLVLEAIAPIVKNNKIVGALEVMSHFNSIARKLKQSDIESAVLVKKEFSHKITKPFTNLFFDGYYVANKNASKELLAYLHQYGIKNYMQDNYKLENTKLIISYPLSDYHGNTYAYFIASKNLHSLAQLENEFFMFTTVVILGLLIILGIYLYLTNKEQKEYYKNIIDFSTNILLIKDKNQIVEANKKFFKYFKNYNSLEDFIQKNGSIDNFFVEEEGYLSKEMDGQTWLEYLIQQQEPQKVKMNIDGEEYYFSIAASKILDEEQNYSIILAAITDEEKYKKELEELTVTDPLTGIKNRRYFMNKLKDEVQRANRYHEKLSLVMFDIDHFKKVNDEHGHDVGDKVLKEYTKLISSKLREHDSFCRIGGEEFIIILPHVELSGALIVAEKLRKSIEKHKKVLPITMSFGVVEFKSEETFEHLFKRVDNALYEAKENGRNRVVAG